MNFFKADNDIISQFVKYFFASGLALLIDLGLLYILTEFLGIYYILSATISFIAGLFVAYVLSKKFIFAKSSVKDKKIEFFVFAVIGIIGLAVNNLSIWFFTEKLGLYYMYSKFITAAITYLWNFFARKLTLFR